MDTNLRHAVVSGLLKSSTALTKSASVASDEQREVLAAVVPSDLTKQSSVTSVAQILAAAEMTSDDE